MPMLCLTLNPHKKHLVYIDGSNRSNTRIITEYPRTQNNISLKLWVFCHCLHEIEYANCLSNAHRWTGRMFYTCVQARLYTELRIQKLCDSFYPAFETLSVRLSLKSGNQSHFPHEQWLNRRLFTVDISTLQFLANAWAPERRFFWNSSALFDLFLYPGVQAVCAKSRGPNNQKMQVVRTVHVRLLDV